jgi:hypothetical protein
MLSYIYHDMYRSYDFDYRLDATQDSPHFGRLFNRSTSHANCRPRVVRLGETYQVYMQATQNIKPNTELQWNYDTEMRNMDINDSTSYDSDGQMGVSPGVDD